MKNLKLLCLALCLASSASAQYFQHLYGTPRREHLESGVNSAMPPMQGHIMTGFTSVSGMNDLMVTQTDLDGRFTGPLNFNNLYQLKDPNPVDSKGRRVVQFPTQQIGIWGDYSYQAGGVSTMFFYTVLNPNGTPTPTLMSYTIPGVYEVQATSMCLGTSAVTNGQVFVCGWVRFTPGGIRSPIIMCLNAGNGAINWAWQYQIANAPNGTDWAPMDLVESPYPNGNTGGTDLALTGEFVQPTALAALSGCYFTVDVLTGANTSSIISYGTQFANGAFNAIEISSNGFGCPPGFVLGGRFFNNGVANFDSWILKIDPTGFAIGFSVLQDYTNSCDNFSNDVIERVNTTGAFEYYLGGYASKGVFGGNDDVVFKLDFSGAAVPIGQFTYGGPGNEQVEQLDQYNFVGPNSDGLSMYGNTDGGSWSFLGASDFYFVKSYFNGLTACNYDVRDFKTSTGPGIVEWWQPYQPNTLNQNPLNMNFSPVQDAEICWTNFDPNGNNNRMAQTVEQQILEPGYFPNPVARDNAVINVTFENVVAQGEAEMELRNALGQLVWKKQATLADGQTQLEVDLGDGLNSGMYQLMIRQNGTVNNYRIVVK